MPRKVSKRRSRRRSTKRASRRRSARPLKGAGFLSMFNHKTIAFLCHSECNKYGLWTSGIDLMRHMSNMINDPENGTGVRVLNSAHESEDPSTRTRTEMPLKAEGKLVINFVFYNIDAHSDVDYVRVRSDLDGMLSGIRNPGPVVIGFFTKNAGRWEVPTFQYTPLLEKYKSIKHVYTYDGSIFGFPFSTSTYRRQAVEIFEAIMAAVKGFDQAALKRGWYSASTGTIR